MEIVTNAIMLTIATLCLFCIALLLWVAHLLGKIATLERALRRARAFASYYRESDPKRHQRL